MHLFKIENENFTDPDIIKIKGENFIHIKKSLRKKVGNHIFFTEGKYIYECRIEQIEKKSLLAEILSRKRTFNKNKIKISLFISLIKFSNFEMILNYATQLGVAEIHPITTEYAQNSIINANKIARWEKIIREASKQSFNPCPPVLKKVVSFHDTLDYAGLKILLHPYADISLKDMLKKQESDEINVYIGPEAGFSENEIKLAKKNKINIVKLPYNILRSETAVISLVSNILFL